LRSLSVRKIYKSYIFYRKCKFKKSYIFNRIYKVFGTVDPNNVALFANA
jgi:hypothetical protein